MENVLVEVCACFPTHFCSKFWCIQHSTLKDSQTRRIVCWFPFRMCAIVCKQTQFVGKLKAMTKLKNVHPSRAFWSTKYGPEFHIWLSPGLTTAINKKWGHFRFLPSYWSNLDWLWHNDVVTQSKAMTCLLTHTKIISQESVIVCCSFFLLTVAYIL